MFLEFAVVFVLAMLAGGWAIAAGVLIGLDPWGVYFAAVLGSLTFAALVLTLGPRLRDRAFQRFFPDAESKVRESRATEIVDRWGTPGLALFGSILLGPTITLLAALILGLDRKRFAVWWLISTVVGFAGVTIFWVAVA